MSWFLNTSGGLAEWSRSGWDRREVEHPGDPLGSSAPGSRRWPPTLSSGDDRGCAFANAAVELPEKDHPALRVIEAYKSGVCARLARLCAAAGFADPEPLADELFLLLEGARVTAQSVGPKGLDERLIRMGEAMIKAHTIKAPSPDSH